MCGLVPKSLMGVLACLGPSWPTKNFFALPCKAVLLHPQMPGKWIFCLAFRDEEEPGNISPYTVWYSSKERMKEHLPYQYARLEAGDSKIMILRASVPMGRWLKIGCSGY